MGKKIFIILRWKNVYLNLCQWKTWEKCAFHHQINLDWICNHEIHLQCNKWLGATSIHTRIPRIRCVAWQTKVKQGKFVELFPPPNGYFAETYKSQNINPISPTPKLNWGMILSTNSIIPKVNLGIEKKVHLGYHTDHNYKPINYFPCLVQ